MEVEQGRGRNRGKGIGGKVEVGSKGVRRSVRWRSNRVEVGIEGKV